MSQTDARNNCFHDSAETAGEEYRSGFLTLPQPKDKHENFWFRYLFITHAETDKNDRYWLDITEELPATNPRKWVYSDGTPVLWTRWQDGQPNNHGDGEPSVEGDYDEFWHDVSDKTENKFMCVYYMPHDARYDCQWLHDYADDDSYLGDDHRVEQ